MISIWSLPLEQNGIRVFQGATGGDSQGSTYDSESLDAIDTGNVQIDAVPPSMALSARTSANHIWLRRVVPTLTAVRTQLGRSRWTWDMTMSWQLKSCTGQPRPFGIRGRPTRNAHYLLEKPQITRKASARLSLRRLRRFCTQCHRDAPAGPLSELHLARDPLPLPIHAQFEGS